MTNYIKLTDKSYPWTESGIKAVNPDTSFPVPFNPGDDYKVVFAAPAPEYNPETQFVREGEPKLTSKGHYEQTWEIVDFTEEEIANKKEQARQALVAQSNVVSMRQARIALHRNGYLAQIDRIIEAMEEPAKTEARIEWDYSTEIHKNKALVQAIASALNLDEYALADLFIEAKSVE